MTRRKPHTVEDRTEKFNQREARRGLKEAAEREKDARDVEETIPGEKPGE
jgi:hypothetical protein